jgi:tRNA 2-thiouridine synthesizing protein A
MKLDVRGEICPYPMLRTIEALNELKPDEELDVLTDHAPALATIPWQAAKRGYLVDVQEIGGGEWQLTLRRTDQPLDPLKVVQDVTQRVNDGTYRRGLVGDS